MSKEEIETIEYEELPEGWSWKEVDKEKNTCCVICPNGHEGISTSAELRDGTKILYKVECPECGLERTLNTWDGNKVVMLTKLDEEDSESLKNALKELQREDLIEFIVITQHANDEKHALISGEAEHLYDWIKEDIDFNKNLNLGGDVKKCLKKHYGI